MSGNTASHAALQIERAQTSARPYQVEIDGLLRGAFEDLRDAISSARIAKIDRPLSRIVVVDKATGQLVIEVE